MTEEQKQALKEGRAAAKAKKLAEQNSLSGGTNTPGATLNPGNTANAPANPAEVPQARGYTQTEVDAMLAAVVKGIESKLGIKEAKKPNSRQVRLYRFHGKFVVDFKNMNEDPYDRRIIHAFDKWDERERKYIPWITLMFEDKSEESVPLKAYTDQRLEIWCDVIKRNDTKIPVVLGQVERKVVKDSSYVIEGTGMMVDQTIETLKSDFTVKTPQGVELTVPSYILA